MPTVVRQYFAQVGSELIQVPTEHVDLHRAKARFTSSAPVRHYVVRGFVGDNRYEGQGASWKEAEAAMEKQVPK